MRATFILLCILGLAPSALAQSPVDGCTRQCTPKATDVNSPAVVEWGGPVNVIQYTHIEDILTDAALNAFPPDPTFEKDVNQGFLLPTLRASPPFPASNMGVSNNWFRFLHCPGAVTLEDDEWRQYCHARGLGDDMVFASSEIPVYFYISPDAALRGAPIGAAPNVVMYAQMLTGVHGGSSVARSETKDSGATIISRPGQSDVFEMRTVMRTRANYVPATGSPQQGYRVEIGIFQYNDQNVEAQQTFRVRSGHLFPARVILPLMSPITFVDNFIRNDNGTIHYFFRVTSDLGAYDVDRANVVARLESRRVDLSRHLKLIEARDYTRYEHDGSRMPVMFHYAIDTRGLHTKGPLIFDAAVQNQQGTYVMHHAQQLPFARFDEAEAIPGPPIAVFLSIVLLLGALRSRRPAA